MCPLMVAVEGLICAQECLVGAELEGVAAAACSHQEEGAVEFLALLLWGYFLSHLG